MLICIVGPKFSLMIPVFCGDHLLTNFCIHVDAVLWDRFLRIIPGSAFQGAGSYFSVTGEALGGSGVKSQPPQSSGVHW